VYAYIYIYIYIWEEGKGREELEALSRNPTDGGFTALAFQLAAVTKYLNAVLLSYWLRLLSQHQPRDRPSRLGSIFRPRRGSRREAFPRTAAPRHRRWGTVTRASRAWRRPRDRRLGIREQWEFTVSKTRKLSASSLPDTVFSLTCLFY